jgi:proline-rich protein PRCC
MRPNRLQRQRHQLNQLAFDAKARELEFVEKKRCAGIKTNAETHAKYGW